MVGSINIFGKEITIKDNKNGDFITSGYSGYMGFFSFPISSLGMHIKTK